MYFCYRIFGVDVFDYLGRYNSGDFGRVRSAEDESMRPANIELLNTDLNGIEREVCGQVEEGPVARLLLKDLQLVFLLANIYVYIQIDGERKEMQ